MFDDQLIRIKGFMACGHESTGIKTADDGTKTPVCLICVSKNPIAAKTVVDLSKRKAQCIKGCGEQTSSSPKLREFVYRGKEEFDSFYDGCEEVFRAI